MKVRARRFTRASRRQAGETRCLPPSSCVNYVGQAGNAALPPFETTRPVNLRGGGGGEEGAEVGS